MKFFATVVFVVLTQTSVQAASIQDSEPTICQGADDDWLIKTISVHQHDKASLPSVPPEEAKYLESEENRGLVSPPTVSGLENWQKISENLNKRPYYQIFLVHRNLDLVIKGLKIVLAQESTIPGFLYPNNPELNKAYKAAQVLRNASILYETSNSTRLDRKFLSSLGMTTDDIKNLTLNTLTTDVTLPDYIQCKLAKKPTK